MTTTEVIEAKPDQEAALQQEAQSLIAEAKGLAVTDAASYQRASDVQNRMRARIKAIEEFFEPMRASAHAAYQAVLDRKSSVLNPFKAEYDGLGYRAGNWFLEDKRRREAEERKRKADQDRLDREAEEAQRKAEAAAKKKGLPPPPPPSPPPPPPPVAAAPKLSGGGRTPIRYGYEVTDLAKVPRKYLIIDHSTVQGVVDSLKLKTEIPGIRVFEKAKTSGRA